MKKDNDGASYIEYLLLFALIAAVVVGVLTFFGSGPEKEVKNTMQQENK